MLRAWRRAFAPLNTGLLAPHDLEVTARQLDRRSPIAQIGFSAEAREVLAARTARKPMKTGR
jgi:hypothetical protein